MILKTDIHSFVLDTETFLCLSGDKDFDIRSLITFGVRFVKGFTQQNTYSIQNSQLMAWKIQFNIYQPSMVTILYSYYLANSNLKISSILFNAGKNCQMFAQIMTHKQISILVIKLRRPLPHHADIQQKHF